jgi:hypothetical protein
MSAIAPASHPSEPTWADISHTCPLPFSLGTFHGTLGIYPVVYNPENLRYTWSAVTTPSVSADTKAYSLSRTCNRQEIIRVHRFSYFWENEREFSPAPATDRQETIMVHRFCYFWENESDFSPASATDLQEIIRVHRFSYFWENEKGFSPAPATDRQQIIRVHLMLYFWENERFSREVGVQ